MSVPSQVPLLLTAIGLAVLALLVARTYLRLGGRERIALATAIGLMGLASGLAVANAWTFYTNPLLSHIASIVFLLSAVAVAEYRGRLVPSPRVRRELVLTAVGLAILVELTTDVSSRFLPLELSGVQLASTLFITAVWLGVMAEAVVRFWKASGSQPPTQRARLRSVAAGFGGFCAVVLLIVGASALATPEDEPAIVTVVGVVALALIVPLYLAFVPPRLVRRMWRGREERSLMAAASPVLFAPDRATTAVRAVGWATRLLGADAGLMIDADGRVLAATGLTQTAAEDISAARRSTPAPHVAKLLDGTFAAIAPLPLESGTGLLALIAGPLTPPFGDDELLVLRHSAETFGVALDHRQLEDLKNAFLTGLSHEMRTPLTSIIGVARTLERWDGTLEESRRRPLIDSLVRNADKLGEMLAGLLDLSQATASSLRPELQTHDVAEIVRLLIDRSEPTSSRALELDLVSVTAPIDRTKVERLIECLLSNAVKHTPSDAKIWIRVGPVPAGVEITVEDDGPGIPEGQRETMLQPFRRGNNVPSHSPGTGTGLAVVALYARLHGGAVRISDREGGGASVRVTLPAEGAG